MFMGEYSHSIDAKGRTIIPAKLREELGETFVITAGLDGNLLGYSESEWKKFEGNLESLPVLNQQSRMLTRFFLSKASTCELDKQGRFLIPAVLREHAGLDKDIVFVGAANKIEIWDKEKWDKCNAMCEENMDDIVNGLSSLGITF